MLPVPVLIFVTLAAPSYDTSSWDLHPGSIPRTNSVGDTPAGSPVISAGGIVTDPAQVAGTVTNVCLRSSDFSSASWTKIDTVIGADSVVCPDGVARTTTKVTVGTGGWRAMYQRVTGQTANTAYKFSIWIWTNSGTKAFVLTRNNTSTWAGRATSGVLTATTAPQRFSLAYTTGAAETASDIYVFSDGLAPAVLGESGIYYLFGAQLESVGNLSTPGPYVPTAATSDSGVRGEYEGQPSDPGIMVPVRISDPRTWGVGVSASKASWAGADAIVDIGGQLSGTRWNSARLETTASGALVLTVINSAGASATRTVAAHGFSAASTHKLAIGAMDGVPFLIVDGVASGTLAGAAVLSSFPASIGVNSTVHPVAKTVYRVSQGSTPWDAYLRLR